MDNTAGNYTILAVILGTELFGSERANLEALRNLKERGCKIHVAVSGREPSGGAVGEAARTMGFDTFEMPFGSHFTAKWMLTDAGYRRRQLKRLGSNSNLLAVKIKEIHPSHLMFSTVLSFMFCGWATLGKRIPLIYRIGDAPVVESRFQLFFWRWLVRRATHIVCVSDFIRNQVLKHSGKAPSAVSRIYNVPIQRPGTPNEQTVQALKERKRPFQLVFVGQINPVKGIVELIEACLDLSDSNLGLWVVGGAGHNEALLAELEERVKQNSSQTAIEFFGFQADPRPYYLAADWHAAPSTYAEPMANTTFEAKIAGIPSLVSNKGGFPEVIDHGTNGWIVDNPTTESIRIAIEAIQSIDSKWAAMGTAAADSVVEHFNHAAFSNRWMEVIKQTAK